MGSTLVISREALDAMVAHAASSTDEVCGLLLAAQDNIHVTPCRNVANNPAHRFEIDPAVLIAAHRAARSGGPVIAGYYHSHPGGNARPSIVDAAQAAPDGMIWLIVAGVELAAFRAVPDGTLHGRFDPVTLPVAD